MAIKGFQDTDCIQNIVEKGEIAHFELFYLFLQCFLIAFFFNSLKGIYLGEGVKTRSHLLIFYFDFFPGLTSNYIESFQFQTLTEYVVEKYI